MKPHPLAHLGDAGIAIALLVALIAGAPLEWIVGIMLAGEVFSCLMKALNAALDPLVETARSLGLVPK